MDLQFYPTPFDLAKRAWDLFKNDPRDAGAKILEPSAGSASLMEPYFKRFEASSYRGLYNRKEIKWDACEFDAAKHPFLRETGARVVGHDFLAFTGGEVYSHIIMNPPFAQGCEHLLHAWDILFEGEIVCILNAETVKNPFSKERQHLVRLIEKYGSVEYIENAFKGEDVEREANVEVALVYLCKEADTSSLIGDILGNLSRESRKIEDTLNYQAANQVMMPKGFVEDLVARFNCAVDALRESSVASAKAAYYRRLVGHTLAELNKRETKEEAQGLSLPDPRKESPEYVKNHFSVGYDELKDAAWSGILRSTEVLSKLSSKAQRRMEKEFQNIKELEFTVANVYGFLLGLAESAGEIQTEMVCDVFDSISRYHEDNAVFYMGWKSNGKHRTAALRVKTTRFILPGFKTESWNRGLCFENSRTLADFDKVFAMLDGRSEPVVGLVQLFRDKWEDLRSSQRCTSDYFDVRYYPKRGTIHFFPRSKELMDRLNRVVGQRRQWLPSDMSQANKDFVKQYESDKLDTEIRETFKDQLGYRDYSNSAFYGVFNALTTKDEESLSEEHRSYHEKMASAMQQVMDKHGLKPFDAIEHQQPEQLLLLAA